jgi:feruloyl esterase
MRTQIDWRAHLLQKGISMKARCLFHTIACLGIVLGLLIATGYGQVAAGSCENLKGLKIPETTIVSAHSMAAGEFMPPGRGMVLGGGQPPFGGPPDAGRAAKPDIGRGPIGMARALPAFCRVIGIVQPAINFEVWLPPASGDKPWNGKFNGVGNGGLAGSISYDGMMQSLTRGYATASTDTGHVDKMGNDSWALDEKLVVDFASRSIHMTAVAAKAIIRAYYNQEPQYSYFTGCSGGGGQALSEAQRYPADYNGIVAGAPANFPTHMWPGELYAAWVTHRDPANLIPNEKLPLITNAVLAACDGLDGVKDGVIDDPRHCSFDPAKLQCSGQDGPDCLTAAQADSVKKIHEGLKDPSTGKLFWYGYEMSSETLWPSHINSPFGPPLSYLKYMAFKDPGWDWKSFSFGDPKNFALLNEASRRLGPILDSTNPNLAEFKKRGNKLIMYHGWIDQNISPRNSIKYFEEVEKTMGGKKQTEEFLRLFMAPGMAHCSGGPGPNKLDALASLEQWVEKGKAPDQIIATRSTDGNVDRARPLCPYPQVAKYKGSESIDDAANFVCTSGNKGTK